jgi:uncharacterized repeat protein (TIGR03803 family)
MEGEGRSRVLGTVAILILVLLETMLAAPGALAARNYKTLYKFMGGVDGRNPYVGLIDQAGIFYGTTYAGGAYNYGTVFKLKPNGDGSWSESVIHSFNFDGKDGYYPGTGLTLDSVGNLYGATLEGGAYNYGMVFKLTPSGAEAWKESVVHSFNSDGKDGFYPYAGVIFDPAGNLYGTTQGSGPYCSPYACGTVFKLIPNNDGSWSESVIHLFNGYDGAFPVAGVIFDAAGNLYGTTVEGGFSFCKGHGCGTVFKLRPNGDGSWTESVIHSFSDGQDDRYPFAGLILDAAGNLYGATGEGGGFGCGGYGCGTVFKLKPYKNGSWAETVIYSFKDDGKDGTSPPGGMTLDRVGNLYGTTFYGGTGNYGTVFKLAPTAKGQWKETLLHSFTDQPGAHPDAGVIFDGHGGLYGTTFGDHITTWGSVFEITP